MLRKIKINWDLPADFQALETPFPRPQRTVADLHEITAETFTEFLDAIGLIGMGGSGFQSSEKIKAAIGSHTLIINGIECEPGITIDQSILLNDAPNVIAGARACAKAIGANKIILAVKNDSTLVTKLNKHYGEFELVTFSTKYPAGAEKLILKKLTGKMPPPNARPYQYGFLIHNVASLWAIGRALVDGIPVVERPLTLTMPSTGFHKNIIVPIGLSIRDLLAEYDLPFDPALHFISSSGLMMGKEVGLDDPVEKTTLSIFILKRDDVARKERPCTRCGACNTACPLGLHPFMLTEQIRKNKTASTAFNAQMSECFLCGVCSAVCPSDLPLVQTLERGKQCL